MTKIYKDNEIGKKEFVEEVINTIVENEGHFAKAQYEKLESGEYIVLYRHNDSTRGIHIDITADSIEAVIRDFMKWFILLINKEDKRD